MHKFKKNSAFTLAEVLITLGIIGIIAAITIPTLLQNSQDQQAVSSLKKTYSTLSQAYTMAAQENGTPDNWNLANSDVGSMPMLKLLVPYMNTIKDCSDGSHGCFPSNSYLELDGTDDGVYDDWTGPKVQFADGIGVIAFGYSPDCSNVAGNSVSLKNICGEYDIDINGFKKPNQWGKDMFKFWLTKYGIVPAGTNEEVGAYSFANDCGFSGSSKYGVSCAAWVIYNGNRDYLKCPGVLSWGGQTKCN